MILAALAPHAAANTCPVTGLQTTVITKQGAEIIGDGGVLVAATRLKRDTQDKSPGNKPGWKVRVGGKKLAPKIDTLAPGLFVYRMPFDSQTTPIEMEDEKGAVVAKVFGSKAKVAVYDAPAVTKLEFVKNGTRRSSQMVTATLSVEPPADTYALVIANAKGQAISWYPVNVASAKVQHGYMHDYCEVLPDGMTAAMPGEKVTLFWINTTGRASTPTKPITVGGKPNPY